MRSDQKPMESITERRRHRSGRRGRLTLSATAVVFALVSIASSPAGADLVTPGPANDQISGATGLGSARQINLQGQSNQAATAEVFSVFDCVDSHHTVWYRWTAPQQGVVQFFADAQANGDDLTIAAFDGQPSPLFNQNVACNDDAASGTNPIITFGVEKGHTYYVAVGSNNEFTAGPFELRMRFVNISITSAAVDEGSAGESSSLPFTVTLSSSELNPLRVTVVDRGTGTAQAGVDYQAFPTQTVEFGVGVTSRIGTVTVFGNDVEQPNRRIIVAATNATVIASAANPTLPTSFDPGATARLTIRDDDE